MVQPRMDLEVMSNRSMTGLIGESQNPLAGLKGWKLYKDPLGKWWGDFNSLGWARAPKLFKLFNLRVGAL